MLSEVERIIMSRSNCEMVDGTIDIGIGGSWLANVIKDGYFYYLIKYYYCNFTTVIFY